MITSPQKSYYVSGQNRTTGLIEIIDCRLYHLRAHTLKRDKAIKKRFFNLKVGFVSR